jgi:phytoene synthase
VTQQASAEAITKASKSNLALALVVLPKERRRDMTVFYAFCRIVDDIADEPSVPPEERRAQLDAWRQALETRFEGEPPLAEEVRGLIARYRIPVEHFREIIAGVEMDLTGARYAVFEDLRLYCYRVASAVGLVSIEIFGYTNPRCQDFAINLGLALQLTNIIRDVGEDWRNGGRVYLPLEDLERFHYTLDDLAAGQRNENFLQLMKFEAGRARQFYSAAAAALPPEDARSMAAAGIMRNVYRELLEMMEQDGFRVFQQRYSLGKGRKIVLIVSALAANFLNRPRKASVP